MKHPRRPALAGCLDWAVVLHHPHAASTGRMPHGRRPGVLAMIRYFNRRCRDDNRPSAIRTAGNVKCSPQKNKCTYTECHELKPQLHLSTGLGVAHGVAGSSRSYSFPRRLLTRGSTRPGRWGLTTRSGISPGNQRGNQRNYESRVSRRWSF
jgi:hypothetical protein